MPKTSKKTYSAAGLSQDGVNVIIDSEERKRLGMKDKYPFTNAQRKEMLADANGAKLESDIIAVIDKIAGPALVA